MPSKRKQKGQKRGGRWQHHPVWLRWDKECKTYTKLIKDLKANKSAGGKKWRDSMIRHYTNLLGELKSNEPPKYL